MTDSRAYETESITIIKEALTHKESRLQVYAAGDSMSPLIKKGDTITIKSVAPEEIKPGDIAVFDSQGKLCAHRLIRKYSIGNRHVFITKSDKTFMTDISFEDQKLIGKVACIRKATAVLNLESMRWSIINRAFGLYHLFMLSLRQRLRPFKDYMLKKLW
jgi:signal peptidase I